MPPRPLRHQGSKQALFTLAVRTVTDLAADDVPAHLTEVFDVGLLEPPASTRALLRCMPSWQRDHRWRPRRPISGRLPAEPSDAGNTNTTLARAFDRPARLLERPCPRPPGNEVGTPGAAFARGDHHRGMHPENPA